MLKLALVGAGSMAKNYISTLENTPSAKITAILAKSKKNLEKLPSKYLKTTKIEEILDQKIKGVIIATPASTHFKLASTFLKKNINVLIEKPLALNLKDAQKLKRIKSKANLMVAHTLLFHPAYKAIKKILGTQKITSITFEGYNNNPRKETTLLWDWGPHPASIFLDLIQSYPLKIKKEKFQKNEIIVSMKFKQGIKGLIKIGWNSKNKIRKITINTTEKKYIFDDMKYPKLEVSNLNGFSISYPKLELYQPLEKQMEEYFKLIDKKKTTSDLDFGIRVVKFLEIIQKS